MNITPITQMIIGYAIIAFGAVAATWGGHLVKGSHERKRAQEAMHQHARVDLKLNQKTTRPLIFIKPGKIEYSNWSEKERLDDPEITSRCEKIILYFWLHNNSNSPARNVDFKTTSFILKEKTIGQLSRVDIKGIDEHNIHLITKMNPGRQPFVLALDKGAVKHFNDGTIKVKLVIKVKYNNQNDETEHWNDSAFIYSPTFKGGAKEIYSKSD